MDFMSVIPAAKTWLQSCLSHHESCHKRARLSTIWSSDTLHLIHELGVGDMMPKRLLRLDSFPGEDERVYLTEPPNTAEEIPYIALSYCWGKSTTTMPKTLKLTMEASKVDGLPVKALPKTFRDAIQVTRGLSFEYLWIDALCIVQDDVEDWKSEAPRMAVVYGNAICTLHAIDACDSDKGLSPRNIPDSDKGVLESRGWTVQERAISPRSIFFGRDEIWWECREGYAAANETEADLELSPISIMSSQDDVGRNQAKSRGLKVLFAFFRDWRIPGSAPDGEPWTEPRAHLSFGLQTNRESYQEFLEAWWDLVPIYTARYLTQESDRFLAMNDIAAVAQRWVQLSNSWGLWKDFLHLELLWYVDPSGPTGKRTDKWLAPSWSWAANKEGRVRNGIHENRQSMGHRYSLYLKPEIEVPYGTSFDQSLPIPAWKTRESYSIGLKGDLRPGHIIAYVDKYGRKQYEVKIEPVGRWTDEVERHDFRPDDPDDFPVGEERKVIVMLFIHYDSEYSGQVDHLNILLVLRQRKGEQQIGTVIEDVEATDIHDERTMIRLGYLETRFKAYREKAELLEDLWLKQVWLV